LGVEKPENDSEGGQVLAWAVELVEEEEEEEEKKKKKKKKH
jgi:hypothetical protein